MFVQIKQDISESELIPARHRAEAQIKRLKAKYRLLAAIADEYENDVFNMNNITPGGLNMTPKTFWCACIKLQNEGLIKGFVHGGMGKCVMRDVLPTVEGIELARDLKSRGLA